MKNNRKPAAVLDLGAPQPFALTGDGEYTRNAARRTSRSDPLLGPKLAEARYLDWIMDRNSERFRSKK